MVDALIITLLINVIGFIIAYSFRSDKFTDASYALSFAGITAYLLVTSEITIVKLLVALVIFAWALRLGGYLVMRIRKIGRDKRFDDMRDSFVKFGQFWLLQAVTVWIVMLAATLLFNEDRRMELTTVVSVGLIISVVGIIVEGIADIQKFTFINAHPDKWVSSGLWKYSRHPNYFGEILMWIGIYVASVGWLPEKMQWIALMSPLFISAMLLFVSGIPLVEASADKKWGKDKKYQSYRNRTSILIPLPPAKIK